MTDGAKRHHDVVRRAFAKQAETFGSPGHTVSSEAGLQWAVKHIGPAPDDRVLDVAAGNGLLTFALAPQVREVVAADITPQMLRRARRDADRVGLTNVRFEECSAEELPFPDASFDVVVTRFSVHHFAAPAGPAGEMARVCRRGGKVALIDMIGPADEKVAATYNGLERLRDPSHTLAYTERGLRELMEGAGLWVTGATLRDVEVSVETWLAVAGTPEPNARRIRDELRSDIQGHTVTGFNPFVRDDCLMYRHQWCIVVAAKP